jgi:tetratricopeptide (TPR) repeat protein
MVRSTPCPEEGVLRLFLLGHVEGDAAAELEAHFSGCARCVVHAPRVATGEDPVVEAIRSGSDLAVAPVPDTVLEKLRGLGLPPRSETPPEQIGPYRIVRELGRGGMGVVYLARHEPLNRSVAMKLLRGTAAPERVARFRRESEAIAALRHANVVQVFEVGDHDGRPFEVMEFVPGGSLANRLAVSSLPPTEAAKVVEAAARAVAAAHARGVIHRDLKPANILLDPPNGPKVADFGLAKFCDSDPASGFETESGVLLGTPGYMAPEQAAGSDGVGPAADVYGLGAVLYECLTGRPPFKAATVLETLDQVRSLDPVSPRRLEPKVPRDLDTVCMKCLDKDPNRRYRSAAALADDLGRFLRGESVVARPVGPARRLGKWIRRRPALAALLATSGGALIALSVVIVMYNARLREALDQARAATAEAERQQEVASIHYRSSRSAVRRMLGRLDEAKAADLPRLQELRQQQLGDALAFYQDVLTGLDDSDPGVRLDASLALVEVGSLETHMGRPAEGWANLERAVELLEALPPGFRTRPECRYGLIQCHVFLADRAIEARNPALADQRLQSALAETEALVREQPADPDRLNQLARVEHQIAAHARLRDPDEARKHYGRAVEIRTDLIGRHPRNETYRLQLAETLLNLGLIDALAKQPVRAAETYARAESLFLPLLKSHPDDDAIGLSLAGLYVNWGNLLRQTGDLPAAGLKFDRAVELAEAAVRREPRYATARRRAVETNGARALLMEQTKRFIDAVAGYDRVVENADEPARTNYRIYRVVLLARAGRHASAIAEAHDLARTPGLSNDSRYNLACACSLSTDPAFADPVLGALAGAITNEMHAAAAVRHLRQLHEAGYFRKPEHAKHLNEDPDLRFLHNRPDFRRLLADVATGPKL